MKFSILSKLELFSCLISAIIHDCDHPGQTNKFLIEISDPLAILHNDNSVSNKKKKNKKSKLIF